jgi:hypothetical protein
MEGVKSSKYFKDINQSFYDIDQLIEVPNLIQRLALDCLKKLDSSTLKNTDKIKLNNSIQLLENISDGSIKESFKIIYNQVCILAVSASNATLEKYFINFITSHWKKLSFSQEVAKLSLAELSEYNFNIKPFLGEIILKKITAINFQDLQSIVRSFEQYCKKSIVIDDDLKKIIIFYQQCRHVLVHKNGYVDKDFIKKTGNNNLKNYMMGDKIELNKSDWINIKNTFPKIIEIIVNQKSEYDLIK